jgi:hypothetical protein
MGPRSGSDLFPVERLFLVTPLIREGPAVQLGWGAFKVQIQNGVPGGDWIKQLGNGSVAQVQLGAESYGGWTLLATAPPIGRQASGC